MTSTRSAQWCGLYERLSLTLLGALGDSYQGVQGRRARRQLDISSARGAVNAALADALEGWNIARPDALQRLPPELAHEIFRELDFRDRTAVSHVSRAWRTTALADPFLWNAVVFDPHRLPVYYPRPGGRADDPPPPRSQPPPRKAILCELLARSDPVPFSLAWENDVLPEDILDIVLSNMHRMQALAIDMASSGFRQLFALPAPELRLLSCTSDSDDFHLPARWDAPLLQKIELSIACVPADGDIVCLPSVTHFSCFELRGLSQRRIDLFEISPGLTSLDITIFWPEMLPYLLNPPETLAELTLRTNDSPPIDYTPLLEACRTCQLRQLRLDSVEELPPVVSLFTSTVPGTWTLDIHRTGYRVGLAADAGDTSFVAFPESSLSFAREPRLASHLSHVSALSAPVHVLAELDSLEQWDRRLPVLRRLTISCTQTADWPASTLSPIHVPSLESVAVAVFGGAPTAAAWVSEGLPAALRLRFMYARPLLTCISIESEVAGGLSEHDLSGVRALSEVVLVTTGGETREYKH